MLHSRRLRLAVILGAAVLLAAQWVTTGLLVSRAREAAMTAASETVQRIARAVEASLNRNLVSVDAMLAGMPAILAPLSARGSLDMQQVEKVLRELNNQNFTFRDVLLVRPDGIPVATGLAVSRRRPLPSSLTAAFFDSGSRAGAVMIGGPFRNPATGEWALFMARRITLPETGPLVAVAEVPVPVISTLLAVSGEGGGLRISLERDDGTLMASLPHDETLIGHKLLPPSFARLSRPDGTEIFQSTSRFNGDNIISAVRPTLYPTLSLAVSMQLDAALAGWEKERTRAYMISAGFAVLVMVIAATLILALRQREKVEAERSRWRSMLESAIDSMTDGFVMWDADDRLIACNSRYKDFYRASAPFIKPGAHFDDIMREGFKRGQYPQAGNDVDTFLEEMRLWHRGENRPMERLLPDGRWVLVTERATPGGGTVGIRTDITEIKRTIDDLAAARDAAAAAGEAKSQFLARMSHELRTPLNSILGFAQVLLNDPRVTADQKEQLQTLHDAARHLLDLVNGLLDLSKIAAGRLEIRPAPTELRPLLERCVTLMGPEIVRKQQSFHMDVEIGTPEAVLVDPMRLRQLLLNLLSNAVKFTPERGEIWLRAGPLQNDKGLRLEVQDSGPGVPPDKQHMLFQDFVQLAAPTTGNDVGTGTGLGLAIASQLAALMDGRIGYDSPPEGGALFWVELPLPEAELPWPAKSGAPGKELEPQPASLPPPLPARVTPLRVLVVDDVAANRLVARAMLTSAGHHVTLVEDGAAALAAVQAEDFDLVLMDLQMPVMDGLESTRRIRQLPPPRNQVPIVAVTASVLPEQVAACTAAGMNAHLSKPIDRENLLRVVIEFGGAAASSASAAAVLAPALDMAAFEALTRDLGAAAPAVMAEFVVELRRGAETLAAMNSTTDAAQLRALVHRLAGVSRTLGATRLVRALEALNRSVIAGDHVEDTLEQARTALQDTLPEILRWLDALPMMETAREAET
ncbi:ATP-binding protein [Roseomonas marmotae]|uniref:histidine kinase n=1 Tax=Roseomonas marmotae TaxID=2768161 RepID=A0ABS3KDS0_9PROT|nr:ATP-binding protein [Roseomonas marmotae]MBO1074481.1 response regulator [Roseomonas marmotae]QTI78213.1 response regulator [Roseomonas marmotae]